MKQGDAPMHETWPLRKKNDITCTIRCDARRDNQTALSHFGPSPFSIFTLESRAPTVKQKFCDALPRTRYGREFAYAFRYMPAYHSINTNY